MDLLLPLRGPRSLLGPAPPVEAQVPSFVLGRDQRRVVVLQKFLHEDALLLPPIRSSDDFALVVHADVVFTLFSLYSDVTPKRFRLDDKKSILAPIISVGVDFLPQDLYMFPCGPAVQLIDPDLFAAQVIRVSCVVLDVNPKISIALLGLLQL